MNKYAKIYSDLALTLQKFFDYKYISVRPIRNDKYNVSIYISMNYATADARQRQYISDLFENFLQDNNIRYHRTTPEYTFNLKVQSVKMFIGLILIQ